MLDRCSDTRLDNCELVVITWQEDGRTAQQLGNLERLSSGGVGIIVDYPLATGTVVKLDYGKGEVTAVVRHCCPVAERHFIVVKVAELANDPGVVSNRKRRSVRCNHPSFGIAKAAVRRGNGESR